MNSSKSKITLKKNKAIDKIWHPESTLVFKSATEKKVVGRCIDDEFLPLDEECLSLCEQWGFKYDTDLVDDGDEGKSIEERSSDNEEDKPVDKPVDKSVDKSVDKPVDKLVDKVSGKSTNDRFINLTNVYNNEVQLLLSELTKRIENLEKDLEDSKNNEEKLKLKFKQLKSIFD